MDLVEERLSKSKLYFDVEVKKWPIIYSKAYNIGFLKMEKLHPFDSGKWGRVHQFLKDGKMLTDDTTVVPYEATEDDLMVVHSQRYLDSLKLSYNVARITEVPPVAFVPNMFVQWRVLTPIKHQVGGTILAGKLAMERGWAINIGGGFHHCSADSGGGFCIYADITLCVKYLFAKVERVKKAMIIDLDAHQGNGYQRDFMHDDRVYIMDVFNSGIYPRDEKAKEAIRRKVELKHYEADEEYLRKVETNLEGALNEFHPDVIIYNAGTDVLDGDPLGMLEISANGIIQRDELVFRKARERSIAIVMLTSGGYQHSTARIIADSILNLWQKKLIAQPEAELAVACERPMPYTEL